MRKVFCHEDIMILVAWLHYWCVFHNTNICIFKEWSDCNWNSNAQHTEISRWRLTFCLTGLWSYKSRGWTVLIRLYRSVISSSRAWDIHRFWVNDGLDHVYWRLDNDKLFGLLTLEICGFPSRRVDSAKFSCWTRCWTDSRVIGIWDAMTLMLRQSNAPVVCAMQNNFPNQCRYMIIMAT